MSGNLSGNITQYKDAIINRLRHLEQFTKEKVSKFKLLCKIAYRQSEKSAGVSVAYEGFGQFGKVLNEIKDSLASVSQTLNLLLNDSITNTLPWKVLMNNLQRQ